MKNDKLTFRLQALWTSAVDNSLTAYADLQNGLRIQMKKEKFDNRPCVKILFARRGTHPSADEIATCLDRLPNREKMTFIIRDPEETMFHDEKWMTRLIIAVKKKNER